MENNELQTSERLSARAQIMNTLAPAAQGLKHTSLYSTIGMGLMLATGSAANATIISGSSASLIIGNGDTGGVGWDIDGDTIDDIVFTDSTANTSTFCLFSSGAGAGLAATGESILSIGDADTVGAGNAFRHLDCADLSDATCVHEHWDAFLLFNGGISFNAHVDVDGVMGFVFDNGGTANYGLAQFEIRDFDAASGNTGTFQITNWVYDDTGADILGSAISGPAPMPEPSALALTLLGSLAMGASGLRQRRRRLASQSQH